jgi:hypothetical protein
MTKHSLSKVLAALALFSALSACGGGDAAAPVPTATRTAAPKLISSTSQAGVTAAMPAPDCAPEGCKGLRIIDGNAEAWRADAAKRDMREAAAQPGS